MLSGPDLARCDLAVLCFLCNDPDSLRHAQAVMDRIVASVRVPVVFMALKADLPGDAVRHTRPAAHTRTHPHSATPPP